MATDRQAMAALDDIDRILRERIGRPGSAEGRSLSENELSAEYWEIRLRLDTALTLVDKIPVYGRRIATAVRFLMQICDRHCVASADAKAPSVERAAPAVRKTARGGRNEPDLDLMFGHETHGPRSLRKATAEYHSPSKPGGSDRGLLGLI